MHIHDSNKFGRDHTEPPDRLCSDDFGGTVESGGPGGGIGGGPGGGSGIGGGNGNGASGLGSGDGSGGGIGGLGTAGTGLGTGGAASNSGAFAGGPVTLGTSPTGQTDLATAGKAVANIAAGLVGVFGYPAGSAITLATGIIELEEVGGYGLAVSVFAQDAPTQAASLALFGPN